MVESALLNYFSAYDPAYVEYSGTDNSALLVLHGPRFISAICASMNFKVIDGRKIQVQDEKSQDMGE